MWIGYNTNGFAHHRLEDTVEILSEIGYRGIAITLEPHLLDPPNRAGVTACIARLSRSLASFDMRVTVETGSRFILDPRRKHQPTLISAKASERARRLDFLESAIDVAHGIGADCVSLWSGAPAAGESEEAAWDRLVTSLQRLCAHAHTRGVRLGFEPEPGMLIETMNDFERLVTSVDHPAFGLTLDVGHVHCLNDGDPAEHLRRWRDRLWNLHVEDMRRGTHHHLMFGDGDMAFEPIAGACAEIGYAGPVTVELSRHSHDAVNTAQKAFAFLAPLFSPRTPIAGS